MAVHVGRVYQPTIRRASPVSGPEVARGRARGQSQVSAVRSAWHAPRDCSTISGRFTPVLFPVLLPVLDSGPLWANFSVLVSVLLPMLLVTLGPVLGSVLSWTHFSMLAR